MSTLDAELIRLTAARIAAAIESRAVSATEVTQAHLSRIAAVEDRVHAFLHVDTDGALAAAAAVDAKVAAGERLGPLEGVPVGLKDVFTQRGVPTTAGSKILAGWRPPYDATVTAKLRAAGTVIIGKTNMDEFAMGSSTENSAYGPTHNPWALDRIPGGSSGGSAAAVAAFEVPISIGTDTGGSIRQPAAVCGLVGVKPTYGAVSRYGLIAFSSSLDQGGPFARTVLDAALLHTAIAGYDPRDSTSIDGPVPDLITACRTRDLKGTRVGVVHELTGEGFEPGVQARFDEAVATLTRLGADVVEVSCPHFDLALSAYYLIAPSECSSNLARFDAMRFGLRVGDDGRANADDVMAITREAGFGPEVKRRIILGTYALSSGYYEAYYGQAQKVRTLITRDFEAAFGQVDVLVTPTTPGVAFRLGEKVNDPISMYRQDIASIPSNLAGNASMSLPVGLSGGLPVGLQIIAPPQADDRLYAVGAALEATLDADRGHPLLEEATAL